MVRNLLQRADVDFRIIPLLRFTFVAERPIIPSRGSPELYRRQLGRYNAW